MANRRLGMVAAAVVAFAVVAAVSADAFLPRTNTLTFSRSVGLPGTTLAAGAYTFETLDAAANLVRVWDRDRTRVMYTGFTNVVNRPARMKSRETIVFGESARGEVPPIAVWYPLGSSTGHQFIYR